MKNILYIALFVVMSGCATYHRQYTWVNPYVSSGDGQRRLFIDRGECSEKALQEVHVPTYQPTPEPVQPSMMGGSGLYTPNYGEAFIRGYANATQLDSIREAKNVQNQVFLSCMASRGWTLR